jgi:hypothetical protein
LGLPAQDVVNGALTYRFQCGRRSLASHPAEDSE